MKRRITFPSIDDSRLAEFVGIMLGDGHIGLKKYEISITENSMLDMSHIDYAAKLIKILFNLSPKIYIGISKFSGVVRCKIYSKDVQEFILDNIGLSTGKKLKSSRIEIPKMYFEDKNLLSACIRGIFDTDGCICRHRKTDPMIEIDACNIYLRNSIVEALKEMNLKATFSGRKIYIYSKKEINDFFEVIGSRNLRNLFKYKFWKKYNLVPKTNIIISDNRELLKNVINKSEKNNKFWVCFKPNELFKYVKINNYLHAPIV